MAPMGDGECGIVGEARPAAAAPAGPEGWRRYLEVNAGFDRPMIYQLTRRGFFSEVLLLTDGILRALVERRRLIVGGRFNGLPWEDFFESELPSAPRAISEQVDPASLVREKSEAWFALMRWIDERRGRIIEIPELGLVGDDMSVRRWLFRGLCRPSAPVVAETGAQLKALGLVKGAYSAIHVRRGDKVAGVVKHGRIEPEGEATPIGRYAELVHERGPGREVFVMTDDHGIVEELAHPRFGLRVLSLCQPEERGYDQPRFAALAPEDRRSAIRRLIVETEIAIRSGFFAGGYRSNVARYVATMHARPDRCTSVDSQRTPWETY